MRLTFKPHFFLDTFIYQIINSINKVKDFKKIKNYSNMNKILKTAIALSILFLLTQCTTSKKAVIEEQPTAKKATNLSKNDDLDGLWILESTTKNGFEIKAGTSLTIKGNQFSLYALCNNISGKWTISNNQMAFDQGKGMTTLMACIDGYEGKFTTLFYSATKIALQGTTLMMTTPKNEQLIWKKQDILSHLIENQWNVSVNSGNGVQVTEGDSKLTMTFLKNGTVSGMAGCNTFFGTYKLEKGFLILENVGLTRKLCPNEVMTIENNFMKNINKTRFAIEDAPTQIILRDTDGSMIFILDSTI
ncbi:hypothetical protein B0A77_04630 [Flavobacterium branchiophilum]|uniref:DUF306 domain-containing protein n=2 Tax=Flavobacterium branchiophilum TaxID=55197 RepID=A0A2H3KP44_9FLAO|nr:hypothetical protein B0A77_04630 [Flavobacterium branchiophilum]